MSVNNQQVKQQDRESVFHSWSIQNTLNPLVIQKAEGSRMWDYDGKEYLDFSCQLVNTNIGHSHPKVVAAIQAQAAELATIAPSTATQVRNLAAERILSVAPKGFKKIFFTNGGADAVENAIRMARLYTKRDKVLSSYRSYHGNTGAAIVATGDQRRYPNEYARGHVHFFSPYLYRSEFWATNEEEENSRALHHLRRVIESEGSMGIAAIILESVPGTIGITMPSPAYIQGVRKLCDEFGIVMIMDEVMAGFGRTGKWLALEHYDVQPDLVTFAKGVNSGYVPVGGVMMSEKFVEYFDDKMFPGGLTYSGHPLAMASIVANIDAMKEEKMVENAAMIGRDHIEPALKKLMEKHQIIGEVRGVGVFWAIELVSDRQTRAKLPLEKMNKIKALCFEKGLVPFIAENRIHVVPACNITPEEVAKAMAIYDEVLSEVA